MGKIAGWKLGKDGIYRSECGTKMWVTSRNKVVWKGVGEKRSQVLEEFSSEKAAQKWAANYRRRYEC
jgi:hypothetical protein